MRIFALSLAIFAVANFAAAATCPLREIKPNGNFLRFGGYVIELKNLDQGDGDSGNPPVWPDGMSITPPAGKECSVPIAIIEAPFFLAGSHTLYVDTYSGSEDTQFLVDVRNCGIIWSSPQYVGPPTFLSPDRFTYEVTNIAWGDSKNQSFTVKIGRDCLPGKPVFTP